MNRFREVEYERERREEGGSGADERAGVGRRSSRSSNGRRRSRTILYIGLGGSRKHDAYFMREVGVREKG